MKIVTLVLFNIMIRCADLLLIGSLEARSHCGSLQGIPHNKSNLRQMCTGNRRAHLCAPVAQEIFSFWRYHFFSYSLFQVLSSLTLIFQILCGAWKHIFYGQLRVEENQICHHMIIKSLLTRNYFYLDSSKWGEICNTLQ